MYKVPESGISREYRGQEQKMHRVEGLGLGVMYRVQGLGVMHKMQGLGVSNAPTAWIRSI